MPNETVKVELKNTLHRFINASISTEPFIHLASILYVLFNDVAFKETIRNTHFSATRFIEALEDSAFETAIKEKVGADQYEEFKQFVVRITDLCQHMREEGTVAFLELINIEYAGLTEQEMKQMLLHYGGMLKALTVPK